MENYTLFLIIAIAAVLTPGPGVVLTLTNTIRYGVLGASGGIFGIACGTFIVAGISATSLGVILTTSSVAFTIMKYIGAVYLIYLGVKLWRSPAIDISKETSVPIKNRKDQFLEGLTIQLTNPKVVFFFMSIFPQFITTSSTPGYISQFTILVLIYSFLNLIIHFMYAYLAATSRYIFTRDRGGRIVNRIGGGTMMCFGVGLASASK